MNCLYLSGLLFMLIINCASEDLVRNSIDDVSDSDFDERTKKAEFVLVYLYSDKTENTETLKKELQVLELVSQHSLIKDLQILKVKNSQKIIEYGLQSVPKLLFFRKDFPILYDADVFEAEELIVWLEQNREMSVKTLTDDTFEHLTQAASGATTGDWFVLFYQKKCSGILPTFEAAASRLKHRMVFARVDIKNSPKLEKRFKLSKCSTLIFFRLGKMYAYELKNRDVQSLVSFAEGFYKNSKMENVPGDSSPFDGMVEKIALYIKEKMESPNGNLYKIGVISTIAVLLLLSVICCCARKDGRRRPKFD